jgi:hypothetical protein
MECIGIAVLFIAIAGSGAKGISNEGYAALLLINLRTAMVIGIEVPQALLAAPMK